MYVYVIVAFSLYYNNYADINECTSNTDNCDQTCSNTVGGFNCGCNAGYQLDSNRRTCNGENTSIFIHSFGHDLLNFIIIMYIHV